MIHGTDRSQVEKQIQDLEAQTGLQAFPREVLFSTRCFKQTGARYQPSSPLSASAPLLDEVDRVLINRLQPGIEITDRPFQALAQELHLTEEDLLLRVKSLIAKGTLSRFAPLYNIEPIGGKFILTAMEVPTQRLKEVIEYLNSLDEVAHNYERKHRLNLWFVVATETEDQAWATLQEIERHTGIPVFGFPKEKEYFLELQLEA